MQSHWDVEGCVLYRGPCSFRLMDNWEMKRCRLGNVLGFQYLWDNQREVHSWKCAPELQARQERFGNHHHVFAVQHLKKEGVCRLKSEEDWSRTTHVKDQAEQECYLWVSFRKEGDGWIRGVVQPVERSINLRSKHSLLDLAIRKWLFSVWW